MTELSQPTEPAATVAERLTPSSKRALDVLSGVQRLIGDEIVFARDEMLDRAQTETHLFGEFVSKMAQAHSVNDIKTMYEVCSQHQVDFVRRNFERLFDHTKRSINVASKLFDSKSQG